MRSDDDIIRVDVVKSLAHAIFPAADGSIVPALLDETEHRALLHNLYHSPSEKHVSLVLPRVRRTQFIGVLQHLSKVQDWEFLDIVSIVYEKTVQSNASSFVRNSEPGFLFYKNAFPNLDQTKWFNPQFCNCSTTWHLAPQPEEAIRHTSYQKFCWELMLLMVTLSKPLYYGRFIYALPIDDNNILQFAFYHQIPLQLYADSNEKAASIIEQYNEVKANMNPRAIAARRKRKLAGERRAEEKEYEDDEIVEEISFGKEEIVQSETNYSWK